jgi:hypothetical protein
LSYFNLTEDREYYGYIDGEAKRTSPSVVPGIMELTALVVAVCSLIACLIRITSYYML